MAAASMPGADIDIGPSLIRDLLREQHPDLAGLELTLLANGWDNVMYRLGPDLIARLPRRAASAQLVRNEMEWLPRLAPLLPLPVPVPVRVGRPNAHYPWFWTIVPAFEGDALGVSRLADPERSAAALGRFLAALHRPAPGDAPPNPHRGGPLARRADTTLATITTLASVIDAARVGEAWQRAAAQPPWTGAAMWIHGDLHPLNIVQRDGQITAIVDFGDVTAGDPATDLLVAWALFDPEHRAVLRASADSAERRIDEAMWERGRGWAITHALATLARSADAPAMRAVAMAMLARATI